MAQGNVPISTAPAMQTREPLGQFADLPRDSVLHLDAAGRTVTRPSQHAERAENEQWIRLALELLSPDDRRVIVLRQWEELSFGDIGVQLGIGESGARMRYFRALPKLASAVEELAGGSVES